MSLHGSQRFAILLCKFSDSAHLEPNPVPFYEDLFIQRGTGGMNDYWIAASLDAINLDGSQVFGWKTLAARGETPSSESTRSILRTTQSRMAIGKRRRRPTCIAAGWRIRCTIKAFATESDFRRAPRARHDGRLTRSARPTIHDSRPTTEVLKHKRVRRPLAPDRRVGPMARMHH